MTWLEWWNSKPRTDAEEDVYLLLQEVWNAAVAETERKCCEIAAKRKKYRLEWAACATSIIEEIQEND